MPPRRKEPEGGRDDADDQARSRHPAPANSTVIKVLAGTDSFELTRGDVNRHPDSLLHSLLSAVETSDEDGPITLDLSSTLNTTLFSTFTQATAVTVALYRHERLPVQLLSDAAKSHNTRDLLDLLQQLLDFLDLPGPVSRYLPAKDNIPLQHLGVLDMHVEAAALHAVNLMLGSSVFSSSGSTGSNGAAFFCVRLKEEVSSHYEVLVYAMSGGDLHKWPKGSDDFAAGTQVVAVPLPAAPSGAEASSSSSSGGSIKATEMVGSPYMYGVDVSGKVHRVLSERISTVLRGALAQVPFRGSTGGGLQQMTFTAYWSKEFVNHKASCVRAVWW